MALLLVILAIVGVAKFDVHKFERHQHSTAVLEGMCGQNEHELGLAILLYQQDHGGRYPASLADLLAAQPVEAETLVCPASDNDPPALPTLTVGGSRPTASQIAAALAVPGHVSYVYCGHADWTDATVPADAVVVYEPAANHGDGTNILFADGHSEFVSAPRAARLIAAASATIRPVSAASVP